MEGQDSTSKKRRPPWAKAFLEVLAIKGVVTHAATAAGTHRQRAYHLREVDPYFAAEWDDAIQRAADVLELEAHRRAHDGIDEPVIYQGQPCGVWVDAEGRTVTAETPGATLIPLVIRRYSDTLLIFLLKGIRPHKYRDNLKVDFELETLLRILPPEVGRSLSGYLANPASIRNAIDVEGDQGTSAEGTGAADAPGSESPPGNG